MKIFVSNFVSPLSFLMIVNPSRKISYFCNRVIQKFYWFTPFTKTTGVKYTLFCSQFLEFIDRLPVCPSFSGSPVELGFRVRQGSSVRASVEAVTSVSGNSDESRLSAPTNEAVRYQTRKEDVLRGNLDTSDAFLRKTFVFPFFETERV